MSPAARRHGDGARGRQHAGPLAALPTDRGDARSGPALPWPGRPRCKPGEYSR